jgi:hypothetical protein
MAISLLIDTDRDDTDIPSHVRAEWVSSILSPVDSSWLADTVHDRAPSFYRIHVDRRTKLITLVKPEVSRLSHKEHPAVRRTRSTDLKVPSGSSL